MDWPNLFFMGGISTADIAPGTPGDWCLMAMQTD